MKPAQERTDRLPDQPWKFVLGRALVVSFERSSWAFFSTSGELTPEERSELVSRLRTGRDAKSLENRKAELDYFDNNGIHHSQDLVRLGMELLEQFSQECPQPDELHAKALYLRCFGFREILQFQDYYRVAMDELRRHCDKQISPEWKAVYSVRLALESAEQARQGRFGPPDLHVAKRENVRVLKFVEQLRDRPVPGIERSARVNLWLIAISTGDWDAAERHWGRVHKRYFDCNDTGVVADWYSVLAKPETLQHISKWVRSCGRIHVGRKEELAYHLANLRERSSNQSDITMIDFCLELLHATAKSD